MGREFFFTPLSLCISSFGEIDIKNICNVQKIFRTFASHFGGKVCSSTPSALERRKPSGKSGAAAENWSRSYFCKLLISNIQTMKIRILDGTCGRKVNEAVMAAALNSGKTLTTYHPFCWFDVDDWNQFLLIVWRALAELSRFYSLSADNTKLPVLVEMSDNRQFKANVWFDTEYKGLRYVSLYR